MKPWSTSVAPGPSWSSVKALLFQKMLLNSATGLEKSGEPRREHRLEQRVVAPRRQARRVRHAVASPPRAGADVVRDGVVDDAHVRGVVEHDRAADVRRAVVDDHVVADVDRLRAARRGRRCRRRRRRSSCSGSGCGRRPPRRFRRRAPPAASRAGARTRSRCRLRSRPSRCSRSGCRGSCRRGSARCARCRRRS